MPQKPVKAEEREFESHQMHLLILPRSMLSASLKCDVVDFKESFCYEGRCCVEMLISMVQLTMQKGNARIGGKIDDCSRSRGHPGKRKNL